MGSNGDDAYPAELLEAHNLSVSYMHHMALRCALELGIPDIIANHDGPVTLSELVAQLSIPPAKSSHLSRIMRLLVHLGYFAVEKNDQDQDQGYTLTSSSKLLVSNNIHQPTLAPFLLMTSDHVLQTPSFYLADWLLGPHSTPFESVHGMGLYDYLQKHPDFNTRYNKANAITSQVEARGLLKHLIPMLEGFESLVDVGGGTGFAASIISESAPHLQCAVFDLPAVISDVVKHKDSSSTVTNISFVAGDMFESIPSADVIFFKNTSIAFKDVTVLKRCREVIRLQDNRGKVIIVDTVKDQKELPFESIKSELCYDLVVMTISGGVQKNEMEWKKLFHDAGFTRYKITPTLGVNAIIEVFP